MHKLTTSTIAALEEMLQNTARSAPQDFLPIHFQGGTSSGQVIGHLNPDFTLYLQESLAKNAWTPALLTGKAFDDYVDSEFSSLRGIMHLSGML